MKKNKKIALIRPDVPPDFPLGRLKPTIPLGLAILVGALQESGYDVKVIDDFLEQKGPKWIAKELADNIDFVAVTVNLATVKTSAEILDEASKLGLPTLVGGPEVTVNLKRVLEKCNPDFAILGEGEEALPELLDAFFGARNYSSIKGLSFFNTDSNDYVTNEKRDWMDMDNIPFIPYHLLPMESYDREYPEFSCSPIEVLNTSRGCPYGCTFCSNKIVWSKKYRAMSPEQTIKHVEHALQTGAKGIYFREDHFTLRKDRVFELCRLIAERNLDFKWGCESRVDCLSDELLQTMKAAGCECIWFGVESGSNAVLKRLKKGTTVEQAAAAFKMCRKYKIKAGASVMFGLPEESKQEVKETWRFLKKIKPDWVYFAAFFGLPGSELYEKLQLDESLIYDKWDDLILANSPYMTWPEKMRFKGRMELFYNIQPRVLLGHLKRMGLRRFTAKSIVNTKRILTSVLNNK